MEQHEASDAEINFLFQQTMALVRQSGRDLSIRQLGILLACDAALKPQTIRGLAGFLKVAKPVVTRAVDRLERDGLARRKSDPTDGRSVLVIPTSSGRLYCLQFLGRHSGKKTATKARPPVSATGATGCSLTPAQLQTARATLGWSQGKLASMAEMTLRSVARFECGKLEPSLSDQRALRSALEAAGVIFMDEHASGVKPPRIQG